MPADLVTSPRPGTNRARLLATALLLVTCVGGIASVAWAAPAADALPPARSDGTVVLGLDTGRSAGVPAHVESFVPGARFEQAVTLRNEGTAAWWTARLEVTTGRPSPLTEDPRHGLRLAIDSCAQPWQPVDDPASAHLRYHCAPGAVRLQHPRAIIGVVSVVHENAVEPGAELYLRLTTSLPREAGNEFQDATSDLNFAFVVA